MNYNKTFITFLAILGINLYALNLCHKIAHCALVFTSAMLLIRIMHDKFGSKKTFISLGLLSLVNMIINNNNYHLDHHLVNNLAVVSLLSVFLSAFLGNFLINKLALGNASKDIFYLSVCALIDSFIMTTFLLSNFSTSTIASASLAEATYKIACSLIAALLYRLVKNLSIGQNFLGNNTAN